jgi:hypothetical protein
VEPAGRAEEFLVDNFFGAPTGSLNNPSEDGLSNEFSEIKSRSVEEMAQSDRVQPRSVAEGVWRGTKRIINTDGSYITMGVIPDTDGEFGFAFFSASGDLIRKITAFTDFAYDVDTGKNIMQTNKLPDGTYGWVVAAPGYDVEDGF